MKKIFLLFIILLFNIGTTNRLDIFDTETKVPYCRDGNCSLEDGMEIVKDDIKDIETKKSATEYIQGVVIYLLAFVTLIAVLYIIYAGFKHLTSAGNDEAAGETKKIILSVLIGILIIWLSYAIVSFVIQVITKNNTTNTTTNH